MGLERTYRLRCDGCGRTHNWPEKNARHGGEPSGPHATPRRARAAAKKDGWGRVQIVIREYQMPNWIQTSDGLWIQAGEGTHAVYDTVGRDLCPDCLDKDGA